MIDFRYHLISLIAVILALALGILAGSGFLGGPILQQLEKEVDDLGRTNDNLREEIGFQDTLLSEAESFARSVQPMLVGDALAGAEVVLVQVEGTSGGLVDGIRDVLVEGGAAITTEITLGRKFALQSEPAMDELALATGSVAPERTALLEETARLIGERMAAASADGDQAPASSAEQRLQSLLQDLETAEFVGVSGDGGRSVPEDATFVVIGGGSGRPPFDVSAFVPALAEGLASREGAVLVAEISDSVWGVVGGVRSDIEARSVAVTVDNAETTIGRIAAVLGLEDAGEGSIGHFGTEAGRTALIPEPAPSG